MPLRRSDLKQLQPGIDSLSSLLLGGEQKQQQLQLDQQLKEKTAAQRLGEAERMSQKYPDRSIAVSAEGASIGARDPLRDYFRQSQMEQQLEDNQRLESSALQNEARKLGQVDPQQITALEDVENLLSQNDRMSLGQLQTALARLKEKGALAEGDVERAMPRTISRDIKGIGGYLGFPVKDMISPEERASIQRLVQEKKHSLLNTQRLGKQELEKRAPTLAPTLNRTGKLSNTMESLGYSREQQILPQSAGPADLRSAAQAELERRRKTK